MTEEFKGVYTRAAIDAILSRDTAALNSMFRGKNFFPSFGFLDLTLPYGFTFHLDKCGEPLIRFGSNTNDHDLTVTILRFIEILPLFGRISQHPFRGQIVFNLSDEVGPGHIGFCSKHSDAILIPDVEFFKSDAYSDARRLFLTQPPWIERSDIPFWRGRSTGTRTDGTLASLPRVQLCRIGTTLEYDFAISAITQTTSSFEQHEIADVIGDYRPASDLKYYRYHIDIDGNTSAWSAFFLKLLSGGVVLKVASPYKQWFYDLLVPWVNFVPIELDRSNLYSAVETLRSNPSLAARIGENGRKLAEFLTLEQEMAFAERTIISKMLMQDRKIIF